MSNSTNSNAVINNSNNITPRDGTRVVLREITATLQNSPPIHHGLIRKVANNTQPGKTEHEVKVQFTREFVDAGAPDSRPESLSSASSFQSLASTLSTRSGVLSAPTTPQRAADTSYANADISGLDDLIAACGNIKLNDKTELEDDGTFQSLADSTLTVTVSDGSFIIPNNLQNLSHEDAFASAINDSHHLNGTHDSSSDYKLALENSINLNDTRKTRSDDILGNSNSNSSSEAVDNFLPLQINDNSITNHINDSLNIPQSSVNNSLLNETRNLSLKSDNADGLNLNTTVDLAPALEKLENNLVEVQNCSASPNSSENPQPLNETIESVAANCNSTFNNLNSSKSDALNLIHDLSNDKKNLSIDCLQNLTDTIPNQSLNELSTSKVDGNVSSLNDPLNLPPESNANISTSNNQVLNLSNAIVIESASVDTEPKSSESDFVTKTPIATESVTDIVEEKCVRDSLIVSEQCIPDSSTDHVTEAITGFESQTEIPSSSNIVRQISTNNRVEFLTPSLALEEAQHISDHHNVSTTGYFSDDTLEAEKSSNEAEESSNQPEKSLNEPETSLNEPEKSLNEPEKSLNEPEKSLNEPEKSLNEPEKSLNEPEKSLTEPEKSLNEPEKSLNGLEKSLNGLEKSLNGPEKSLNEPEKSLNEPEKSLNEPEKSLNELEKSLNEPEKSLNEPEKSLNEPDKSLNGVEKSLNESEESLNKLKKSLNEPEKSLIEPDKSLNEPEKSLTEPKKEPIQSEEIPEGLKVEAEVSNSPKPELKSQTLQELPQEDSFNQQPKTPEKAESLEVVLPVPEIIVACVPPQDLSDHFHELEELPQKVIDVTPFPGANSDGLQNSTLTIDQANHNRSSSTADDSNETVTLKEESFHSVGSEGASETYNAFQPVKQSTSLNSDCNFIKLELAAHGIAEEIRNKSFEIGEDSDQFFSADPDLFLDTASLDFFLTRNNSKNTIRDLRAESLYVRFDPLVSNVSMLPQGPPQVVDGNENAKNSIPQPTLDTPKRNPALAAIDRLLFYSPATGTPNKVEEPPKIEEKIVQDTKPEAVPVVDEVMAKELELVRSTVMQLDSQLEKQRKEHEDDLEKQRLKYRELEIEFSREVQKKNEMTMVMDEYEKSLSRHMTDRERERASFEHERAKLQEELQAANHHLENTEAAFNDVHSKYERLKNVVSAYKSNEDVLKESVQENVETIKTLEARYDQLKGHAMAQLEKANMELEAIRKQHETETVRLQAMIRKAELKSNSLAEMVEQKSKENKELAEILDEVIARVGRQPE